MLQSALQALARVIEALDRIPQLALLALRGLTGRRQELANVLRDDADVLEDLGELWIRRLRDRIDVAECITDDLTVLADRLVERLGRFGDVLQDESDILPALLGADRASQLLRHCPHAVGDLLDFVHQLPRRRLVHDDVNLVAFVELAVVGGTGREDDDRFAEERRALFSEGRILVEHDVRAHFHVEARLAALELDRLERAHGDARDRDARPRREPRRVVDECVDRVAVGSADGRTHEAIHAVGGRPRQRDEEPDLGRLRASRHLPPGPRYQR